MRREGYSSQSVHELTASRMLQLVPQCHEDVLYKVNLLKLSQGSGQLVHTPMGHHHHLTHECHALQINSAWLPHLQIRIQILVHLRFTSHNDSQKLPGMLPTM